MWKWLGGCLLVVVFLVIGAVWWGYQGMRGSLAPDGTARVTVAATPSRVFASLANGDSLQTWMAQGNTVSTTRRGLLAPGDTLHIRMRETMGVSLQHLSWQVQEVVPDRLLVLRLVSDTSTRTIAIRRDSLAAVGDSTLVVSTLLSPLVDSTKGAASDTKGATGGLLGMTADLMLSMFRMQSKLDLDRLKAHIETRR